LNPFSNSYATPVGNKSELFLRFKGSKHEEKCQKMNERHYFDFLMYKNRKKGVGALGRAQLIRGFKVIDREFVTV
jgi:hypothetical protein